MIRNTMSPNAAQLVPIKRARVDQTAPNVENRSLSRRVFASRSWAPVLVRNSRPDVRKPRRHGQNVAAGGSRRIVTV